MYRLASFNKCVDQDVSFPRPKCGIGERIAKYGKCINFRDLDKICGTNGEKRLYYHRCFENKLGEAIIECSTCFANFPNRRVDPCDINPLFCFSGARTLQTGILPAKISLISLILNKINEKLSPNQQIKINPPVQNNFRNKF